MVTLNDDQCKAILTEGLNRKLYEHPSNAIPSDPAQRLEDATNLLKVTEAVSRNGNKSDNVEAIMFIARTDQKPIVEETTPSVEPAQSSSLGIDLTQVNNGVLDGLLEGLVEKPKSDATELMRGEVENEIERRANALPKEVQEISQAEAPRKIEEPSTEGNVEAVGTQQEVSNQADPAESRPVASTDTGVGDDAGLNAGGETGTDASAFARAKTPETSKEGKSNEVQSPEEDAERTEVEKELNYDIIKAHGADITKLGSVSTAKLRYMIANPDGPKDEKEDQVGVEVKPVLFERDGQNTVGIANEPADIKVITKADLGLEVAEEESAPGDLTPEREKLESLVTGPMLKAYGRGRKEIPEIGDNELRFMILNSDGKAQIEDLEAARSKDGVVKIDKTVVDTPEVIHRPVQVEEAPDRSIVEAAQEAVAEAPPVKEEPVGQNLPVVGQTRAMEIIHKENFPIAPEIKEDPPLLPFDVSLVTRDELFSLHAKFHACESRINWVLTQYEDELGDEEKLRADREVTVAASVPLVIDDKRVTNEYRDSQVAADGQVRDHIGKEHEIKKVMNRLKVLQKNYYKDCERLSRQMSKYERERFDGPK